MAHLVSRGNTPARRRQCSKTVATPLAGNFALGLKASRECKWLRPGQVEFTLRPRPVATHSGVLGELRVVGERLKLQELPSGFHPRVP